MAINSITDKTGISLSITPSAKKDISSKNQSIYTDNAQDKIDITAVTQKIKNALKSAPSTPVINEDKIIAVKEALREGNYQINADSIAEKILQIDRHFDST